MERSFFREISEKQSDFLSASESYGGSAAAACRFVVFFGRNNLFHAPEKDISEDIQKVRRYLSVPESDGSIRAIGQYVALDVSGGDRFVQRLPFHG
jgi:hypothetical protein